MHEIWERQRGRDNGEYAGTKAVGNTSSDLRGNGAYAGKKARGTRRKSERPRRAAERRIRRTRTDGGREGEPARAPCRVFGGALAAKPGPSQLPGKWPQNSGSSAVTHSDASAGVGRKRDHFPGRVIGPGSKNSVVQECGALFLFWQAHSYSSSQTPRGPPPPPNQAEKEGGSKPPHRSKKNANPVTEITERKHQLRTNYVGKHSTF